MGIVISQNALLSNIVMTLLDTLRSDFYRVFKPRPRSATYAFMAQGCLQHQRLTLGATLANDMLHVFREAHIKHPVRFVEN